MINIVCPNRERALLSTAVVSGTRASDRYQTEGWGTGPPAGAAPTVDVSIDQVEVGGYFAPLLFAAWAIVSCSSSRTVFASSPL
jgi:hypothetical protein